MYLPPRHRHHLRHHRRHHCRPNLNWHLQPIAFCSMRSLVPLPRAHHRKNHRRRRRQREAERTSLA